MSGGGSPYLPNHWGVKLGIETKSLYNNCLVNREGLGDVRATPWPIIFKPAI